MARRESWFSRLLRHFHEHPQGRWHEMAFWLVIGVTCALIAFFANRAEKLSDPLALMLGVIALCFIGWAFLPHPRPKRAPLPPRGKRGLIQQKVQAGKAAVKKKKKGPGPPIG